MKKHYFGICVFLSIFLCLAGTVKSQDITSLGSHKDFVDKFKQMEPHTISNKITLKISSTQFLTFSLNVRQKSGDAEVFIGEVENEKNGTFFLSTTASGIEGNIVLIDKKTAYQYYSDAQGNPYIKQVDIHGVLCIDYNQHNAAVDTNAAQQAPAVGSSVYTLQSLPGATAVALLDFDGQYVAGTKWNSGNPIDASPSGFTDAQVTEMWRMISEDYRPFNINITTDSNVFFAAPSNRRQRCIFTPTNTAAPGSGGVAYVNSFSSGTDNDTPCWVFNSGTKSGGEAGSHELGHTFGLSHDGTSVDAYYQGQGYWAPIMGAAYYDILGQWSKGEYSDANNQEDDVAIITKTANGVTYRADEAGNTNATAKILTIAATGIVSATANYGIITTRTDIDVYSFTTSGGTVTLTVNPSSLHPDLNVLLNLTDAGGGILATANPIPTGTTSALRTASLSASITTTLAAGKYYLQVDGTGEGDVLVTGYTDYGCIGEYTISGTIPVTGASIPPSVNLISPANNATFCSATAITLTATAADADGTISKVEFFDGTTLITTLTSAPYSYDWTTAVTGIHSITAVATDNGSLNSTSTSVSINVNATPSAPTVATTIVNYCQNATANILTATGTSLKWYTVATGGVSSTTAPKPATTIAGTSDYYVSQTTNTCESARTIITVNVNAIPSAPAVVTSVTYCQNATSTALTATGTSLKWYTAATGGTGSATAPVPSTATIGTTSRYVSQTVNGCESSRATLSVTVNAIPTAPTVTTPVNYCQNASAAALAASGTNLQWYTVSAGGIGSVTSPVPVTTATGTTNYYVSSGNGCESARSAIVVMVNAIPSAPTVATSVSYCQNVTATSLTATGTALKWYSIPTGGTSSATAPVPITTITGATNYYVSQTTNGCESPRANIVVTVTATPLPTVNTPLMYCQNTAAIALTATGTTLKWYSAAIGGTSLATAPTPQTISTGTTNYYVSQTTNGCESARTSIAVTVNSTPSAPLTAPVSYCLNTTSIPLTATGTNLIWYSAAIGGAGSPTAPLPATSAIGTSNYYVSQASAGGCESARVAIAVTVAAYPIATITAGGPTTFCQGESVILTANAGSSYVWYNGNLQVGVNATYSAVISGSYTVEVTNASGCKDVSSAMVITVNALPIASITAGGPTTFTQGDNVLLSANIGTGFSYRWLKGPAEVGTGSTYTAITPGNYTVEVTSAEGCMSTSIFITVTVLGNQAPSVTITAPSNNSTFTSLADVTLTAIAGDADGTITKVDFYNGNTLLGTDPTSPYNFALNNLPVGTYAITAIATDNLGSTTVSSGINFTVTNPLPTISITSPSTGSTFIEIATVTIDAIASDANGSVNLVEFYNGTTLIGSDVSSPYSISLTNLTAGTYNITARATDNEGGIGISSVITITVTGNQPSVITVISPADNSIITGPSVTIDITATDPDGSITKVEFLDGANLIGSSSTAPYSFIWNDPTAGTHVITVRVTDSNGGVTVSSPTTFIVQTQTGLYALSANNAFNKVYPNPAHTLIQIETGINLETASIKFLDVLGSEVMVQISVNGTDASADISSLAAGMYTLFISKGDFIIRKKIVVAR